MEYKIQTILLPEEVKHQQCRNLFFRGDSGCLDSEKKTLLLGTGQKVDFTTYLNACSYRKWKKYTIAERAKVHLEMEGEFSICFLGYSKKLIEIERTEFATVEYHLDQCEQFTFEYPENECQLLGFEISAKDKTTFYEGHYSVTCEAEERNPVELCIATTTCKKEDFIKKNVQLLEKSICTSDEEIADHCYIHVIDNGRTLQKEDIEGKNILLHPNKNTGGAGGFTRGMLESLSQTPKATHVLLMDDDVLILPESIKRTYHLLRLMKKEYENSFISGAMLYYEKPFQQHEDVGRVAENGIFCAVKPTLNQDKLINNLLNEEDFLKQKNEYAGWWYCCIPTTVIEKQGYPLPLFIRCDDIEYSLRAKADVISMSGICVWHMGFAAKFNPAIDRYQLCRNLLISKSCSDILQNVDVMGFVQRCFRAEIIKRNYDTAELVLKGFEDYLKGPDFISEDRGEAIMSENLKLNDKLAPLSEVEDGQIPLLKECYIDPPRKFLDKWLLRLTYNGHRFWPQTWLKKKPEYIAFDGSYQSQKLAMRRTLIAVNPYAKTGTIRVIDKKRYKMLRMRQKKALDFYNRNHQKLEAAYKSKAAYLTSAEFWKSYLDI